MFFWQFQRGKIVFFSSRLTFGFCFFFSLERFGFLDPETFTGNWAWYRWWIFNPTGESGRSLEKSGPIKWPMNSFWVKHVSSISLWSDLVPSYFWTGFQRLRSSENCLKTKYPVEFEKLQKEIAAKSVCIVPVPPKITTETHFGRSTRWGCAWKVEFPKNPMHIPTPTHQ